MSKHIRKHLKSMVPTGEEMLSKPELVPNITSHGTPFLWASGDNREEAGRLRGS